MAAKISVIMTVFNRERYLNDAIKSVLAQTQKDFELIIWDDGSSDRSIEIAQRYAQQDTRIQFIAAEHRGRGQALWAAHTKATGNYIGWLDSDDLLAPTALAKTSAILDTHPEIGVVYTNYFVIDQNNWIKRIGRTCYLPYSKEKLLSCLLTFHFRLMRRSVYEAVGGVDPNFNYAEDYNLCLKLSEVTDIYHLKQPLYYYRKHPDSISYQFRSEQSQYTKAAIAQALKRRGLSDRKHPNSPTSLIHSKPN
jgi:glycosyltransferase involved in cell wall biosynthesis